ncbi:hypothetical protein PAPYR_730 [Paratrimastix pyriformis]|uniref:BRCT domain-containing protein n=1 Tax=Paratrimastix pyriformis TaxID=342808 RepID=A0ABQ8UUB9_9EUKA|nr:hypothetical protein PAPYR_730 [Paratrimastix pyriformis]
MKCFVVISPFSIFSSHQLRLPQKSIRPGVPGVWLLSPLDMADPIPGGVDYQFAGGHHYKNGTVQLREIRRFQKSCDDLIPVGEWNSFIVSLIARQAKELGHPLQFHEDALYALQIAAESLTTDLFHEAMNMNASLRTARPIDMVSSPEWRLATALVGESAQAAISNTRRFLTPDSIARRKILDACRADLTRARFLGRHIRVPRPVGFVPAYMAAPPGGDLQGPLFPLMALSDALLAGILARVPFRTLMTVVRLVNRHLAALALRGDVQQVQIERRFPQVVFPSPAPGVPAVPPSYTMDALRDLTTRLERFCPTDSVPGPQVDLGRPLVPRRPNLGRSLLDWGLPRAPDSSLETYARIPAAEVAGGHPAAPADTARLAESWAAGLPQCPLCQGATGPKNFSWTFLPTTNHPPPPEFSLGLLPDTPLGARVSCTTRSCCIFRCEACRATVDFALRQWRLPCDVCGMPVRDGAACQSCSAPLCPECSLHRAVPCCPTCALALARCECCGCSLLEDPAVQGAAFDMPPPEELPGWPAGLRRPIKALAVDYERPYSCHMAPEGLVTSDGLGSLPVPPDECPLPAPAAAQCPARFRTVLQWRANRPLQHQLEFGCDGCGCPVCSRCITVKAAGHELQCASCRQAERAEAEAADGDAKAGSESDESTLSPGEGEGESEASPADPDGRGDLHYYLVPTEEEARDLGAIHRKRRALVRQYKEAARRARPRVAAPAEDGGSEKGSEGGFDSDEFPELDAPAAAAPPLPTGGCPADPLSASLQASCTLKASCPGTQTAADPPAPPPRPELPATPLDGRAPDLIVVRSQDVLAAEEAESRRLGADTEEPPATSDCDEVTVPGAPDDSPSPSEEDGSSGSQSGSDAESDENPEGGPAQPTLPAYDPAAVSVRGPPLFGPVSLTVLSAALAPLADPEPPEDPTGRRRRKRRPAPAAGRAAVADPLQGFVEEKLRRCGGAPVPFGQWIEQWGHWHQPQQQAAPASGGVPTGGVAIICPGTPGDLAAKAYEALAPAMPPEMSPTSSCRPRWRPRGDPGEPAAAQTPTNAAAERYGRGAGAGPVAVVVPQWLDACLLAGGLVDPAPFHPSAFAAMDGTAALHPHCLPHSTLTDHLATRTHQAAKYAREHPKSEAELRALLCESDDDEEEVVVEGDDEEEGGRAGSAPEAEEGEEAEEAAEAGAAPGQDGLEGDQEAGKDGRLPQADGGDGDEGDNESEEVDGVEEDTDGDAAPPSHAERAAGHTKRPKTGGSPSTAAPAPTAGGLFGPLPADVLRMVLAECDPAVLGLALAPTCRMMAVAVLRDPLLWKMLFRRSFGNAEYQAWIGLDKVSPPQLLYRLCDASMNWRRDKRGPAVSHAIYYPGQGLYGPCAFLRTDAEGDPDSEPDDPDSGPAFRHPLAAASSAPAKRPAKGPAPRGMEGVIGALLREPRVGQLEAITVGPWAGEDLAQSDCRGVVEALCAAPATERLTGLRRLQLGKIGQEECEVSWIILADVSPLLAAYPALEALACKGGNGLQFKPVRSTAPPPPTSALTAAPPPQPRLARQLAVPEDQGPPSSPPPHSALVLPSASASCPRCSVRLVSLIPAAPLAVSAACGGLDGAVLRGIVCSHLPSLTVLHLYLGTPDYGASWAMEDMRASSRARADRGQPAWWMGVCLGLVDCESIDEVCPLFLESPLVRRLQQLDIGKVPSPPLPFHTLGQQLDIGKGTLSDAGAVALLELAAQWAALSGVRPQFGTRLGRFNLPAGLLFQQQPEAAAGEEEEKEEPAPVGAQAQAPTPVGRGRHREAVAPPPDDLTTLAGFAEWPAPVRTYLRALRPAPRTPKRRQPRVLPMAPAETDPFLLEDLRADHHFLSTPMQQALVGAWRWLGVDVSLEDPQEAYGGGSDRFVAVGE